MKKARYPRAFLNGSGEGLAHVRKAAPAVFVRNGGFLPPKRAASRTLKGGSKMNVSYTTVGNYQIPNLVMDAQPEGTIGKYGRMRKRYLEEKHDGTFTALVLSGKLTEHLLEIDRTAREQLESIASQMAAAEGITEALKAADQMEWLLRTNSIRARAEEIVIREVVYGE